jgi:hypothetical protein
MCNNARTGATEDKFKGIHCVYRHVFRICISLFLAL